jgi:hypothetical protein
VDVFICGCGVPVCWRRERDGGARLLCEYDHLYIAPGVGEDYGIDKMGRLIKGRFAAAADEAVEVTRYHEPRCRAAARRKARPRYAE